MIALGITSALLLLILAPLYIRQCFQGTVRPHPVSWAVWATIGTIGAITTGLAGAGPASLVLIVAAALEVTTFIVSLRGWEDKFSIVELLPLGPAAVGIVIWLTSSSLLAASVGVVVADICGLYPTLAKVWEHPRSEPALLWLAGAVAFALGCAAVRTADATTLLYPCYLATSNVIVAVIAIGRGWRVAPAANAEIL